MIHESLIFAYNREMDQLVPINNITTNEVEELRSPTCCKVMIDLDDVMTNFEESMPPSTPRSYTSSTQKN
jgi:hypothetical protein